MIENPSFLLPRISGVSMPELIIVIFIIAVLAAIALPAYEDYSMRADVESFIEKGAQIVEKEYLTSSQNHPQPGADFPYSDDQWVKLLNEQFPNDVFVTAGHDPLPTQVTVAMTDTGEVMLSGSQGHTVTAGTPVRNVIPVHYATNRAKTSASDGDNWGFGGAWQQKMSYGLANVSIPPGHQRGALERPFQWWIIEFDEKPEEHIMIAGGLRSMSYNEFFTALSADAATPLLFIHGFNVVFEDAILRSAQLAHDLSVNGQVLSFSWPSSGGVENYLVDLNNNERSIPQLRQFLVDLKANSGIDEINVIAHSMGNQVFTKALASLEESTGVPRLNQVILAAPDIDRFVFEREIATRLQKFLPDRVTLYASTKDKALSASTQLWDGERAGYISDAGIVTVGGIDSIDVSRVDAGWMSYLDLNHSAYGDELIDDIFLLLRHGHSPADRNLLQSQDEKHWILPR